MPELLARPGRALRALVAGLLLALVACTTTEEATAEPLTEAEAVAAFDTAWSTVRDKHFDPTFNGTDWDAVRDELRPRAAEARDTGAVRKVIDEMLGKLGQSHFLVLPKAALPTTASGEETTPGDLAGACGIDVRLRDGDVLVTHVQPGSPAAQSGVALGWIVRSVGGKEVGPMIEALLEEDVDPRHAAFGARQRVLARLFGPVGEPVRITFVDGDDEEVELELDRVERDVVPHNPSMNLRMFYLRFDHELIERGDTRVGYLHFTNWFLPMMRGIDQAVDDMRGSDGFVIDLRGNSGGVLSMITGVSGHFFAERTDLGVMKMRDEELKIFANPRLVNARGERVLSFSGPLAVLIDETSASASECFSGGVQDVERARVFGETSAGAVLPARTTELPNGDVLLYAFADFKTAKGRLLEGTGVVPDVETPLTRAALLRGVDPQLEAAIAWIASQGEQ